MEKNHSGVCAAKPKQTVNPLQAEGQNQGECSCKAAGMTVLLDDGSASAAVSLSEQEITRVKALGFLRDKTAPGCFNGRVITRNGKITAQESRAIIEAAER
ncbi:MAG: hypothetical protein RRY35_07825, partial [Clostridiales bacterium]